MAWNGSLWVAGGTATNSGGNAIAYSSDGIKWTTSTQSILDQCNTIAWNGSIWLACGQKSGGGSTTIITSIDGTSWSTVTQSIIDFSCNSIAWNGSMWIAGGTATSGGGKLAKSTDGSTWSEINYSSFSNNIYALAARRPLPLVGAGNSTPGFQYRASGPTGPTGGPTGPAGPWLSLNANIVPLADNVYDLGATGLRFRDIHVGGSTIYLGDSVSIKATAGGALTATNAAGTVNLITSGGFNGGTQSGSGNTSTSDGDNYYGSHSFSPPFSSAPIVVASITSVAHINSKLVVDTANISASGCRIYTNNNGTPYNWIATARTEALP